MSDKRKRDKGKYQMSSNFLIISQKLKYGTKNNNIKIINEMVETRNHTDEDVLAMYKMENLLEIVRDNTTDENLKKKLNFNIQIMRLINPT